MPKLFAVTGFSGAGKTTAIDFLRNEKLGRKIYVGKFILDELERRGLPQCAESEKNVRLELRQEHGPAFFAVLANTQIETAFAANENVLLDAVLSMEELNYYRAHCGGAVQLVAISTSFEVRATRLENRTERKLSRDDLLKRDNFETLTLGTTKVMAAAHSTLPNEGSMIEFEKRLREFLCDNS
jgi:dephospho-CoA kinase